MVVDAVNGLFRQVLLGRLLKFGEAVVRVQEFAVANKVGPVDQVLMVDVLLKHQQENYLQSVQAVQLAVIQDVTLVKDFQVMYVDRADFVCVHQVVQKRLQNVFGVKTVHTVDVKCLTVDVLTVLH